MRRASIIGAIAGVVVLVGLLFFFGGSLVSGGASAPDAMPADTTSSMAGLQHIVRTTGPFFINATVANHSSTLPF